MYRNSREYLDGSLEKKKKPKKRTKKMIQPTDGEPEWGAQKLQKKITNQRKKNWTNRPTTSPQKKLGSGLRVDY